MKKKIIKLPIINDRSFRALIEKSSDVIVLISIRGKILYASPSIIRIFGRNYEDFVGFTAFKFIHPLDIPKVIKALAILVTKPEESISLELRIKHKDGSWKWLSAVGTNLLKHPEIKGIVANFHDITERKELEERKDEFISIASHEFKTPITIIKGYTQLLKSYLIKDKKAQEYINRMEFEICRLTILINDYFDVTKIYSNKLALRKEKFKINELIKNAVEDIKQTANGHKIIFISKFKGKINADKYRISQVIINLLSNAIKYSPEPCTIYIRVYEKNNNILVSVKDKGEGIAKSNLEKIFQRFYQVHKKSKLKSGLGLGLYICSQIIKLHGGKIWVKSKKGKGSIFTFMIPKTNARKILLFNI